MDEPTNLIAPSAPADLDDQRWQEARRRAAVIGPLASRLTVSQTDADAAGLELGLSTRTVYSLVRAWRRSGGSVPLLAPTRPPGGRGKYRTDPTVELIITEAIERYYLTAQKPRLSAVVKAIRRSCRVAGHKPPALNTVAARISALRPEQALAKREGGKAAHRLRAAPGSTPAARAPLDVIQIDHTSADIIVVEPTSRLPIGRPSLTIAIDEYSRCIVGICVTLEAPSATSVGLCLTHVATSKVHWLQKIGAACTWPMYGKPKRLFVDNGADFHSEGLRRGCEVHGITLDHRPIARPHYGGIVERVIGTAMRMIHELPGTTFSNVATSGAYNSDARAALTLSELEKWIALSICGPYHNEVHGTLREPPLARWQRGVKEFGDPVQAQNQRAFLIDFLPVVKRRIQRHGFVVDRIGYYCSALSPWIAEREHGEKFLIRRDPRDLSRIWVLDGKRNSYIEVPYRTLSNPPMTVWEHRAATKRLREEGRAKIDEHAIFKAVEQMRAISDGAIKNTRAARRNHVRRSHLKPNVAQKIPPPPALPDEGTDVARPFDDIEEW